MEISRSSTGPVDVEVSRHFRTSDLWDFCLVVNPCVTLKLRMPEICWSELFMGYQSLKIEPVYFLVFQEWNGMLWMFHFFSWFLTVHTKEIVYLDVSCTHERLGGPIVCSISGKNDDKYFKLKLDVCLPFKKNRKTLRKESFKQDNK